MLGKCRVYWNGDFRARFTLGQRDQAARQIVRRLNSNKK